MTRLLGALVTVLLAWCGLMQPVQASVSQPMAAVPTYAYDGHHTSAQARNDASERGPPATYDLDTTPKAVDHWSHGDSARLDAAASLAATTYDYPAPLVQVATVVPTAERLAGVAPADLPSLDRSKVAVNAGSGALRSVDEVLGGLPKGNQSWVRMVPDESSLTTRFSELTEGGTPTTWKNFNGTVIERGDGVQVGIRSSSSSGDGAIDIRMPDGSRIRIHVEQP